MSNADVIRSMSDEQLAKFLFEVKERSNDLGSNDFCGPNCKYHANCDLCGGCKADEEDGTLWSEITWWLSQKQSINTSAIC